MERIPAKEYTDYNRKYNFDLYAELYKTMEELFNYAPFQESKYSDGERLEFNNINVYIDKSFGSYCEIKDTGWLPMKKRLELHQNKLKELKNKQIQLKLWS